MFPNPIEGPMRHEVLVLMSTPPFTPMAKPANAFVETAVTSKANKRTFFMFIKIKPPVFLLKILRDVNSGLKHGIILLENLKKIKRILIGKA